MHVIELQMRQRHGSHLAKFLEEFVYLAVKICHRGTLASATPSFQVGKNFENRKKHQRRRIAWVGQADFGKLELNISGCGFEFSLRFLIFVVF